MSDLSTLLAGMLGSTATRIQRVLADVSEEDARARPQGLTPIVWQVGHMAFVDSRVLVRSGVIVEVPASYERSFTTGSGGEADFPPLTAIVPVMMELNDRLQLLAVKGDLTQPIGGTRSYASVGEALGFVVYHRGYHIGKITTLRALLGKARVFG